MKHRRLTFGVMGVLATLSALGGCNIVAPAVILASGPPKRDAVYALPEDRPTLVFVDDRDNRLPRRSLRMAISDSAQDLLMRSGTIKPEHMIDAKVIATVTSRESATQPMDIQTIARQAQAQIVIYVVPASFRLSSDGQTYDPAADFYIKVLDVTQDKPRLWPEEAQGKAIPIRLTTRASEVPSRAADLVQAEDKLAAECGRVIAELFHRHEIRGRVSEGRPE